jgi:hypothetical protein
MKKKPVLWVVVCTASVLVAFFAGRWSAGPDPNQKQKTLAAEPASAVPPPSAPKDRVQPGSIAGKIVISGKNKTIVKEIPLKPDPAGGEQGEPLPLPFGPPPLDPAIKAQMERENEALKAELSENLREAGFSEEEIEQQLQGLFPPLELETAEPQEAADLSPEQMAAEMEMSLLESGVPPEDVEEIIAGFMGAVMGSDQPNVPALPGAN